VRVGLIGCGKVGQIHATALRALPEAELTAVCDVSAERAQVFAARYGTRGYTDVDTMLREAGVEAVIIGTPHP
jgi:predicted dehydrogenase